jgi:formate dehydrogenase major subunit
MTNHWIDLKNSDCILIMGSNAAENHPISFKWIKRAQAQGATVINVDPRINRTSTQADLYAPLRSGSDIALLAGMTKYILDNDLIQKDYVVNYTNAGFILEEGFSFQDGLFSGFDPKTSKYDKSSWSFVKDENGVPKKDTSLQDPRCVYNMMRKHYERYDIDTVSSITGTPKEKLLDIYKTYTATGKSDKSGTIMYAMGWTQHTVGVQNIRAMAINQLLLGNIGMAGGGVNALRGESNVQGSTDQCLLVHILPGYLATPTGSIQSFEEYNKINTPVSKDEKSANWWGNFPKYSASLLKAMWPDVDCNDSYNWLPKGEDGKNYTWLHLFEDMSNGVFKGFFAWGMNPACSGANSNKTREALSKLDWMVNVNLFDNETGSFWRGPGMDPKKVKTEVFFLPCSAFAEKEGSISNSGRWVQWRYQGPDPREGTVTDGHIIVELYEKLRALYKKSPGKLADPILKLNIADWKDDHGFNADKVARLMNGYFLKDVTIGDKTYKKGQQVPGFAMLQADGSTCSGNWLYCNMYPDEGNRAKRRDKTQNDMQAKIGLYPNWSWCWPVNRRIIYNRASVNLEGQPYAPEKAVIAWDGEKWQGDVPDGPWAPGSKHAFIMKPDGHSALFGPGRNDGPFPEYYEPLECPVIEHPFSKQLHNPTAVQFKHEEKAVCDPRFPFVCTTYRVTEHWQTGLMTRYQGWLVEAEPQMFCEMSEELAELRGIANGDKVWLESVRGKVWAKAIVTKRIKPFTVMGQTVHLVGIPWHFGWVTPKNGGDSANLLTPSVGDPNTGIPESKAFMVNVTKA